MKPKEKKHYVNNAQFLEALKEYRNVLKNYNESLKQYELDIVCGCEPRHPKPKKPRVPNYLGECIYKIASHLSFKPNFINYTFRDDMVGDAVENALIYIDRFDPEKSSNPFAYFTQISWYAFLRRIQKEKKEMEIKNKLIEKFGNSHIFNSEDCDPNQMNTIKSNLEMKNKK